MIFLDLLKMARFRCACIIATFIKNNIEHKPPLHLEMCLTIVHVPKKFFLEIFRSNGPNDLRL